MKRRIGPSLTNEARDHESVSRLVGYVQTEAPHSRLYSWKARLAIDGEGGEKKVPLTANNLLIRVWMGDGC